MWETCPDGRKQEDSRKEDNQSSCISPRIWKHHESTQDKERYVLVIGRCRGGWGFYSLVHSVMLGPRVFWIPMG